MDQWLIAAIAAVGVLGQWYVGSRASAERDGVVDEKLRSHDARLDKHGEEIDKLREDAGRDRSKISVLESRAGIRG